MNTGSAAPADARLRKRWHSKFDRFQNPSVPRVIREFSDRGVGLVMPTLGIDDAASRQTLLNIMGCVLESTAAIATERTTHGMVDVHRGEVAELRAAGMSGRQIATELGFSPRSVFNVLRVKCSRVK
jgi:hypothetical protein